MGTFIGLVIIIGLVAGAFYLIRKINVELDDFSGVKSDKQQRK